MSHVYAKTSDILKLAKKIIVNPEHWTHGTAARNMFGQPCDPEAMDAAQWDVLGALSLECSRSNWPIVAASRYLHKAMENSCTTFNDTHQHRDVLDAWDKAINMALVVDD